MTMRNKDFINFLEQLKRETNSAIIEAIENGFYAILEASTTAQLEKIKKEAPEIYERALKQAENLLQENELDKFDASTRYNPNGLKKWLVLKGMMLGIDKMKMPSMREYLGFLKGLTIEDVDATKKMWNNLGNAEFSFNDLNEVYHTYLRKKEEKQQEEEKLKLAQNEDYANNETVLQFPDGFKWVTNPKGFCEIEAELMGHCGNKPSVKAGDIMFSLRDKRNIPYLTFIVNNKTLGKLNVLGESKGRGNTKPPANLHKYIVPFLIKFVDYIHGGGYAPERNFDFSDLSKGDRENIIKAKPSINSLKLVLEGLNSEDKVKAISDYFDYPADGISEDGKYILMDVFEDLKDLHDRGKEDDNYAELMSSFENWFPDLSYEDYMIDNANPKNLKIMMKIAKVNDEDELKEFIREDDDDAGEKLKDALIRASETGVIHGSESEAWKDIKKSLESINDYGFFVKLNGAKGIEVYFALKELDSAEVKEIKEEINGGYKSVTDFWNWGFKQNYHGYDGFSEESFNEELTDRLDEVVDEIKKESNQTEMSI